jgi:uncharacterized protein (TIGR04255 family)
VLHITLHIASICGYILSMAMTDDPAVAPPPPEVPLAKAPLVRVIAQVRFPLVVGVERRDFIAPFQETVRETYPVLRQEQTQGVLVGPAWVTPVPGQTAWRFSDVDGRWRLSLTPDFLALETTSYKRRSDFLLRLRDALIALDRHIEPQIVDRLGVRYIDRIVGDDVREISGLVRSQVSGISGTDAAAHMLHSLCESVFALDGARVLARWGQLPAGSTVDPTAIEPTDEVSWILDLDMFTTAPAPFVVEGVLGEARRFAERIYTFFRWAVTDEFLRRFEGEV